MSMAIRQTKGLSSQTIGQGHPSLGEGQARPSDDPDSSGGVFDSELERPYNPSRVLSWSIRLRRYLLLILAVPLVLTIACGADQPAVVGISSPLAPNPTPSAPTTRSAPTATAPSAAVESGELTPTPPPSFFRDIVLSETVTEDSQPLGSRAVFSTGTRALYAFFDFAAMKPEMEWAHVWYYETEEIGRETQPWRWGTTGRAYVYRGFPDGMRPGQYELMFYADGILQTVVPFSIQ